MSLMLLVLLVMLKILVNMKIYKKQEGAELCQAQPAKHKLFGSNGAFFFAKL